MDPKDKTNDLSEIPGCSHGNATPRNENKKEHDDDESVRSREIATQLLDETVDCQATTTSRHDAIALLSLALGKEVSVKLNVNNPKMPVLIINSGSLSESNETIMIQDQETCSDLLSRSSVRLYQPPTLFIQALRKLTNQQAILGMNAETYIDHLGQLLGVSNSRIRRSMEKSPELSAPDSLTSAPPSYSFVLRQMAARARRPRLMGTFIPSPSFITHTPPPNYANAFDIYVDNPPPPPVRVYTYGFTPQLVICPDCGYTGMTVIKAKITLCTHLSAMILCLFCCWLCVPLPYFLRSCKEVEHYCFQCNNYLGIYCPTNPESSVR
ncbi:uncharacterized protein LOC105385022 [Plutella xylostella]|uniref:uncharacterized protein LOC105385022 n=1 Tax=Plutella xylostella TaxID=51655 RepID=UPI002032F05D|nr:uncharacterized protein LOC105385022 [Plutella xylostella]